MHFAGSWGSDWKADSNWYCSKSTVVILGYNSKGHILLADLLNSESQIDWSLGHISTLDNWGLKVSVARLPLRDQHCQTKARKREISKQNLTIIGMCARGIVRDSHSLFCFVFVKRNTMTRNFASGFPRFSALAGGHRWSYAQSINVHSTIFNLLAALFLMRFTRPRKMMLRCTDHLHRCRISKIDVYPCLFIRGNCFDNETLALKCHNDLTIFLLSWDLGNPSDHIWLLNRSLLDLLLYKHSTFVQSAYQHQRSQLSRVRKLCITHIYHLRIRPYLDRMRANFSLIRHCVDFWSFVQCVATKLGIDAVRV